MHRFDFGGVRRADGDGLRIPRNDLLVQCLPSNVVGFRDYKVSRMIIPGNKSAVEFFLSGDNFPDICQINLITCVDERHQSKLG